MNMVVIDDNINDKGQIDDGKHGKQWLMTWDDKEQGHGDKHGKNDMKAWQEGQMTHSVVISDLMMSFEVYMLVGDLWKRWSPISLINNGGIAW